MANDPKKHRATISLIEIFDMFPDDEAAEEWFIRTRWPDGIRCAYCDSGNVLVKTKHPTMPYHCRACRKFFSVKTGSVMQSSKIGFRKWALAMYLMSTSVKGAASLRLHEYLRVTYKTAWYMAHRIRESWDRVQEPFEGPVEYDETFIGGKEGKKHAKKRKRPGGGYGGKEVLAGAYDHATGQLHTKVIKNTTGNALKAFVGKTAVPGAMVITDEARGYFGLKGYTHRYVKHAAGEYVTEDGITTNSIESHWAIVKRGYNGVYHAMSPKHLQRYANEFTGRHNDRDLDTIDRMRSVAQGMIGKRLKYRDLTGYLPRHLRPPTLAEVIERKLVIR